MPRPKRFPIPCLPACFVFYLVSCFALLLSGCGALSSQHSPRLLGHNEKASTFGFAAGSITGCVGDTGDLELGNRCVLTQDPHFGFRYGYVVDSSDTADLAWGTLGTEAGFKLSGVPLLGGTVLGYFRIQKMIQPIFLTYDFGLSFLPCLLSNGNNDDDEEDGSDIFDEEEEEGDCDDRPFGGGIYAGSTFGKEWLFAGFKYWIGGNTWDGLQLLPGINLGSAIGPKRFKIIPSADVYFYQWPLDLSPEIRVIYGLGFQSSF